jgi:P pilus assembly chaperone PapD
MGLNNSDSWNSGVSLVSGNQITIANPGVYNIAFSAQMVKNSGNTATHAHIWLSQNGTNVPISASQIGFPSNSVYVVAAWNFFFKTTVANEYVQLKWEINSNADNAIAITSAVASGNVPAIPGLIITVNQVG